MVLWESPHRWWLCAPRVAKIYCIVFLARGGGNSIEKVGTDVPLTEFGKRAYKGDPETGQGIKMSEIQSLQSINRAKLTRDHVNMQFQPRNSS